MSDLSEKDVDRITDIMTLAVEKVSMKNDAVVMNAVHGCLERVNDFGRRLSVIERRLGEPRCPTCGRSTEPPKEDGNGRQS